MGAVQDVRPHYQRSSISICPIQSGSGTRIKILEAMSIGTPVVSTAIGAEGLDVVSGKNIIMADRPHDFAKAIIYLLNHRAE